MRCPLRNDLHRMMAIAIVLSIVFAAAAALALNGGSEDEDQELGNVTVLKIPGTTGKIIEVSASNHTLAIRDDGTLWSWGYNLNGQLGQGNSGTGTNLKLPEQIETDTDWASISAGTGHSLALKSDGTLWSWGYNATGQLGQGDNTDLYAPKKVGTDTDWIKISAKNNHSLALKSDGTLWSWGDGQFGQLGLGSYTGRDLPTKVGIDTKWVSISAGVTYSLALKSDGTLWSWGDNTYGQLGHGNNTKLNVPTKVGIDTKWASISAGTGHSLALKSDGTLWSWGDNGNGQLGQGNSGTGTNLTSPKKIGTDTDWTLINTGSTHSLALKSDGTLWSWGNNVNGQLGQDNNTNLTIPTKIAFFSMIDDGNAVIDITHIIGYKFLFDATNSTFYDTVFWSFGDGDTSELPIVTHTYTHSGMYEIELITTDGADLMSAETLTLIVYDDAPLSAATAGKLYRTTIQGPGIPEVFPTLTTDPESDWLEIEHVGVDPNTGNLFAIVSGTPTAAGIYQVTLTDDATIEWTITVFAADDEFDLLAFLQENWLPILAAGMIIFGSIAAAAGARVLGALILIVGILIVVQLYVFNLLEWIKTLWGYKE